MKIIVCNICKKEITTNIYTDLDSMDFCSKDCVERHIIELKESNKTIQRKTCEICSGTGYEYIDCGYGDSDRKCTRCGGKGKI